MDYLIVLLVLMPGYLWHILYVRNLTELTLPDSAWKLLLPLVFISGFFLILTFLLMKFSLYPEWLMFIYEKYIFIPETPTLTDMSNQLLTKKAIQLFPHSMLLISALSIILGLYKGLLDFTIKIVHEWVNPQREIEILKRLRSVIGRNKKFMTVFILKLIKLALLSLSKWVLTLPLEFLKKVLMHVYLLDDREENEFLTSMIDKTVMVTLKSNRVYVGVLVKADLRQSSDEDDALLLHLSLSGHRKPDGVLKYMTSYMGYSSEKLLFMREVESIAIYRKKIAPVFVKQKSVEYP